jgi:hypothetical protein
MCKQMWLCGLLEAVQEAAETEATLWTMLNRQLGCSCTPSCSQVIMTKRYKRWCSSWGNATQANRAFYASGKPQG